MKYFSWLWQNSCGIRWNTAVRIVTGIGQVVLSLLMVWLSKRFIDETIREESSDDVLRMVECIDCAFGKACSLVFPPASDLWFSRSAKCKSTCLCSLLIESFMLLMF